MFEIRHAAADAPRCQPVYLCILNPALARSPGSAPGREGKPAGPLPCPVAVVGDSTPLPQPSPPPSPTSANPGGSQGGGGGSASFVLGCLRGLITFRRAFVAAPKSLGLNNLIKSKGDIAAPPPPRRGDWVNGDGGRLWKGVPSQLRGVGAHLPSAHWTLPSPAGRVPAVGTHVGAPPTLGGHSCPRLFTTLSCVAGCVVFAPELMSTQNLKRWPSPG